MTLLQALSQLKTLPGLKLIPWPGIIIPNPGGTGATMGRLQHRPFREIGFRR